MIRLPPLAAILLAAAASAAITDSAASETVSDNGAALYQRCAACHLATGAGVPGAYPPLTQDARLHARTPDGRRYLALVVAKGAAGTITVSGKKFSGIMPAQSGLDDAAIASVLTYVIRELGTNGDAPAPFTAAEVSAARASGESMSPQDVATLGERLDE